MSDYSTYIPSASTIPPWPESCTNVTNVYKGCKNMNKAWSDNPLELMPLSITKHTDAVKNAGDSLAELFDKDWGGTSEIFYDIAFYKSDKTIFEPSGTWLNPQRVLAHSDAITPNTEDFDRPYDPDLYTYGWNGKWQDVTADANVTRTYTHKTHTYAFYDLYTSSETPIKGYSGTVNRKSKVNVPDIPPRTHVIYTGWTFSKGETPETSGEVIPNSFFDSVSSDFSAYHHYYIDTTMNVKFTYYSSNVYTETDKIVEYGRTTTAPEIDARTGYTFTGWYIYSTQIPDVSVYPITESCTISAHYSKNKFPIIFRGGYDGLDVGADIFVYYMESLPEDEFPTTYGTNYPNIAYTGWDKSDRTKFENVTSSAVITSNYRQGFIGDANIPTYLSSCQITGYLSEGTVTNVVVNIPAAKQTYYSAKNISFIGGAFSFDFEKTDTVPSRTSEKFTATVTDEKNLSYTLTFDVDMNYNAIDLYLNNWSWGKNEVRTGTGAMSATNVDVYGNEAPYQPNPDRSKYLGVLESCTCWHKPGDWSNMTIAFSGYDEISFYLRNCGEAGEDYPMMSKINQRFTRKPNKDDDNVYVYLNTTTTTSDYEIYNYQKVTYSNLYKNQQYTVDVAFVNSDSLIEVGSDRAYFLFDCPSNTAGEEDKNVVFHEGTKP